MHSNQVRTIFALTCASVMACNFTEVDTCVQVSDTSNLGCSTQSMLPDTTDGLPDPLTTGSPNGETNTSGGVGSTTGDGKDTSGGASTGVKEEDTSSSGGDDTTGDGNSTTGGDSSTTGMDTGMNDTTSGGSGGDPVDDEGLITDPPGDVYAISMALGYGTTYILLNSGEVKGWGLNEDGRLGYGNKLNVTDPSKVGPIEIGFKVKQVVAGASSACALAANDTPEAGQVRCWGHDGAGNLGRGKVDIGNPTIGDDETPAAAPLIKLQSPIVELAAGWQHFCARMENGKVSCWGQGGQGQLGYGDSQNVGDNELPGAKGDVDVGWPVASITAGGNVTCAVDEGGQAKCWGQGLALGNGNIENIGDDELPSSQPPVPFGFPVKHLAIGTEHMCALSSDKFGNLVECVGTGTYGKLGYGNTINQFDAAKVGPVALPAAPTWIDAMHAHTCGNTKAGETMCWGWGPNGNLGYSSTENIGDDDTVLDWGTVVTGMDVARVYTGASHSCALGTSAMVECFGGGYLGYLPYPHHVGDDEVPAFMGAINYL